MKEISTYQQSLQMVTHWKVPGISATKLAKYQPDVLEFLNQLPGRFRNLLLIKSAHKNSWLNVDAHTDLHNIQQIPLDVLVHINRISRISINEYLYLSGRRILTKTEYQQLKSNI